MNFFDVVSTAATCRYYTEDEVTDEELLEAVRTATWAPQGGNRQPVRFLVVQDPELKRQLQEWYLDLWEGYQRTRDVDAVSEDQVRRRGAADHFARHLADLPCLVVVCAERAALHLTDAGLDRPSVVGGASIYPAVQNFLLSCRAQGLGAALTTLLVEYEDQLRHLLEIPKEHLVAAIVAVGRPAKAFPRRLNRVDPRDVVFLDRFGHQLQEGS